MDSRKRAEEYQDANVLALSDTDRAARVLEPGETISGKIVDLRRARGTFFGDRVTECPVVTLVELDPETGEERELWDLWLWHQVPRAQFREKAPQVGDVFHLKRMPDGDSDTFGAYVRTFLVMEGEAGQDFDWPSPDTVGSEYEPDVDPETGEIVEPV